MKKFFVLTEILVSLLFLFGIAHSERTIWYVHPDSSLNTIQAGLDSCANNDIVLAAPGIYYENIVWPNTQGIHLVSELGLETTIIDGGSAGSVIEIDSVPEVDSTTIINGFTVRNGYASIGAGGGILLRYSSPIIENNLITDNRASLGAGIISSFSSAIIINNTITGNIADNSGGGIVCGGTTSPRITGNLITDNAALSFGGGIFCRNDSAIISDNSITGNSAIFEGGGIFCITSFCVITGDSITGNTADFGGGISCVNCSPAITTNTITNNTANEHGSGINCFIDASPYINSCTISYNNSDGVYSAWHFIPVINYNNITNNSGYGVINVDSSVIIDGRYNWWGDASGPGGVGPGTGDEVSDYVDYDPWLDHPTGVEETDDRRQITEIRRQLLVYPNPFTSVTSIQLLGTSDNQKVDLQIYEASGRLIESIPLITRTLTLGNDLSAGVYFLKFNAGKHSITKKLIKIR